DPDLGKVVLYQLSYSRKTFALLLRTVINSSPVRGAHYTRNPFSRKSLKAKFCAFSAFADLISNLMISCAPLGD
ncbi:hypothetical protein, partial [Erwinia sp. S63]|uniref:hypothetical protein n=1 Tax=Erwinia sp. S63 TaxID=2769341 RepID=UPI0025743ED0